MKVGRNDPCPCGSGKKHKHCCLGAAQRAAEFPQHPQWQRVRRAIDGFAAKMLRFIQETYGPPAIHEAWDEFTGWDDESELDSETPHLPVFMPWFFHRWSPDPDETLIENNALYGRTPTSVFLEKKGARLDPLLRRYLEACVAAPFSFYEIKRRNPGTGFLAHDVLTGEELEVLERSASRSLQVGDIVFGQIARMEGIALMEACALIRIPPIHKIDVIELRQGMLSDAGTSSHKLLREWDAELRELYLDLTQRLLNPPPLEIRNTDGEALVPHRLVFAIDSPEIAFNALKAQAFDLTEEDLLDDAERDPQGKLLAVKIQWRKPGNRMHRTWDNTILGRIEIDRDRLICEVNSAERATEFMKIVQSSLGSSVRHLETKTQSLDDIVDGADEAGNVRSDVDPDEAALSDLPELREKLDEMMAAHYEDWLTQSIPALGNRTPLQAVEDSDGREMVEALVRQFEQDGQAMHPPLSETVIRGLRERLGLPGT